MLTSTHYLHVLKTPETIDESTLRIILDEHEPLVKLISERHAFLMSFCDE